MSDFGRQRGINVGWKKEPWERERRTGKDLFKDHPGQGIGVRIPKSSGTSRDQSVETADPGGSSTSFSPLPKPEGRNETEELRAETRQRTQLAKGILESERDGPESKASLPASTHAAAYRGAVELPVLPYASGLQEERHVGRAARATPQTEGWKTEKRQSGRPEKEAVYDRKYRTKEPEPGETAGQGAFRRYVKTPSPEERLREYAALTAQPDFREKSAYQNTYDKSREKFSYMAGIYTDTGFDDILYDYINGNDIARGRVSLAPGVRTYEDVPEEAVRLFNYIYRTKSPEEAYDFMDLISQKRYTGLEAAAFGAMDGMGVTSLSTAISKGLSSLTGDKPGKEWYDQMREDTQIAREQHPAAYGAGAAGGNVALALGLGAGFHKLAGSLATGVRLGGRTVQVVLPKVVEGTVNSSLTFLSKAAVQNAGAAATGEISGGDYLKRIGTAGTQGMAGGLAGGLVNSGLETVLRESGMMTGFMEFVKQSTAGFAAASANMGTGYVLSEEKPSGEQIAMDLTMAFLFSVIQGGISACQTTNATKTYMEKQYEHILSDYSKMSREWNTLTPEEQAEYARVIQGYTRELRAGLRAEYLAGQQGFVNDMTRALDTLDKAMEAYAGHSAPGGSGTAGTLVPAGGGELALRLQESIAEGLSAASVPAVRGKETGNLSAFRSTQAPSGIAKAGLVDDATADRLLRNQSMVDFLTRKSALKLTKAMTQEEKRAAVRQAVARIVNKEIVSDGLRKSLQTQFNFGGTLIREEVEQHKIESPEKTDIGRGEKTVEKVKDFAIIRQTLIGGALDPESERADKHAEQYYESVRKMTTDVKRIAENTGIPEAVIQRIKNFIFMDAHDLGEGKIERFDPMYEMAESWQRLIDGKNIQPHDLTLLRHEIMEMELMDQGYTQGEAHILTSKKYDYRKESEEYYGSVKKNKKRQ